MSYRVLILPPSERTITQALLRKLASWWSGPHADRAATAGVAEFGELSAM